MEANEAPERLYLSKNIYSTFVYQLPYPEDETEVEYIRADAFTEKVCEWLQEHKNDYAFPIYQGEELTDESYVSDDIIKDLRKVIEE